MFIIPDRVAMRFTFFRGGEWPLRCASLHVKVDQPSCISDLAGAKRRFPASFHFEG